MVTGITNANSKKLPAGHAVSLREVKRNGKVKVYYQDEDGKEKSKNLTKDQLKGELA